MRRVHRLAVYSPLLVVLTSIAPIWASEPTTPPDGAVNDATVAPVVEPAQFMRFVQDLRGARLETAEVTYRNNGGQTVRLVGAIHIGEKAYFESLNKEFENDDAVLYELVKPKDGVIPARGAAPAPAGDNPISQLQHFMKDTLKLEFQLDVIDYSKPNFVHADLDKETFEKLQAERGESFEQMMLQQLFKAMTDPKAQEQDPADGKKPQDEMLDDVIKLVTRPDMERQLKLLVARQLTEVELKGMGFGDNSVILGERNKAAMKVLADTLGQGKKKISVFYGAAHMPNLSERLRARGFTPASCEWKTAWDLTIRGDQPSAVETLLREVIKALDDDQ